jgi:hypothetical protein
MPPLKKYRLIQSLGPRSVAEDVHEEAAAWQL